MARIGKTAKPGYLSPCTLPEPRAILRSQTRLFATRHTPGLQQEELLLDSGEVPTSCTFISDDRKGAQEGIVIVLSDIYGHRTPDSVTFCYKLASATGVAVMAPDIFRGRPWHYEGPGPGSPAFESWRHRLSDEWAAEAVRACFVWLRQRLERTDVRVGLMGFCYGGGRVIDVLASTRIAGPAEEQEVDIAAAAAFYATRIDTANLADVRCPLLMIFAGRDTLVPTALRTEYKQIVDCLCSRGIESRVKVIDNEVHGFAHQEGVGSAAARAQAHAQAIQFLALRGVGKCRGEPGQ